MKNNRQMISRTLDWVFTMGGAIGTPTVAYATNRIGGVGEHLSLAIDALIVALVGGIVGYFLKKLLDLIWSKIKKKK